MSTVSEMINSAGVSPTQRADLDRLTGNPAFNAATKNVGGSHRGNGSEATERLFLSRPRYASDDTNNRGTHVYIKLMTSNEQASMYQSGTAPRTQGDSASTDNGALGETLKTLSSGDNSSGYDKFLMTGISAALEEKMQITEVFGDNEVAYFFGRSPMMFSISGMLTDSPDNAGDSDKFANGSHSWFTEWLIAYSGALRGTKLAQNYELLKLVLPNMTLIGSITACSWEQSSTNDVAIPFRFQFLVKQLVPTPVTLIDKAISNSAHLINFDQEQSFQTQTQINDLRRQSATLFDVLGNPSSSISEIGRAMSSIGGGTSAGLGIRGTSSFLSEGIDWLNGALTGGSGIMKGIFSGIGSVLTTLDGIRTSLFAPIYGVMNSLTRLVKNVFGMGGLGSIFGALTAPIRNILGDITRIATQASAIVGIVTAGTVGFGRQLSGGFGIIQSYQTAIRAFHRAAGIITASPLTVSHSIASLTNGGLIPSTAAFLQSNPKHGLSRTAILSSNSSSRGKNGATLHSSGRAGLSPQLAILSGGHKAATQPSASL